MGDVLEFGTVPFAELLSPNLRQALGEAAVRRLYRDTQLIHRRGDRRPGLSIVRSGAVKICNFGADGSAVTTAVLGPGQVFGEFTLLTNLPRTHDAIAVGATAVDRVSRAAFASLVAREPELLQVLAAATARRLYAVLEFLDDLRRLPLPVLTAKILRTMARASDDPNMIECSQSDLAVTLGVSRVSIGKTIRKLEQAGLIEQGYGRIIIRDNEQLDAWIAARDDLFRPDE
jgi:CRP-like cAMP-binding protein